MRSGLVSIAADPTACPVCGRDACEEHLAARPYREWPPDGSTAPRLSAVPALELIDTPRAADIIQGVASEGGVTFVVGDSGAGKSFLLKSMSAAVSDGVPWHGRQTRHGSVIYVSYEGDALQLRFRALRDVGGHHLDNLHVIRATEPLSPLQTRDGEQRSVGEVALTDAIDALNLKLEAKGKPSLRLLIIDTLRASSSGSEDSSEHAAAYLRAVRRIGRRAPDAAILVAHHSGWQDGDSQRKRERGSSAWRGNVDMTLYLEAGEYDTDRGEARLTLRTLKVRDAERPAPLQLIRRRVALPGLADANGQPATSCLIERDTRTREDRQVEIAEAAAIEHQAEDLAVLKAMRDHTAATSISRLRPYLGLRTTVVSEAVARIISAGLAAEGKRGQPYAITEAGLALLTQERA